jgi:dienelactone hydrolase
MMDAAMNNPLLTACAVMGAGALFYLLKPKPKIGECCPGQSHGFLPQDLEYKPKGSMEDLDGLPVYVTGSGTKTIVIVHDIFGLHTGRHKQIADEIAKNGFLVIVPDFFVASKGGMWGKTEYTGATKILKFIWGLVGGGMKSYIRDHPWDACKHLWEEKVVPWLAKKGVNKVGLIGFCWGAWLSYRLAANSSHTMQVLANVAIHPSTGGVTAIHGEDQQALVRGATKAPTCVFSTILEPKAWQPGGEAQQWMEAEAASLGKDPKVHIQWRHVKQMHGFVTRGDMKGNLKLAQDVKLVLDETLEFLKANSA